MEKKKGFTLVELLVVIAIIALLMGILMPALSRVRQIAFRMVCGSNLSGIGKAMLIYANDYEDELPRSGGRNCNWVPNITTNGGNWLATTRQQAYGTAADGTGGSGSITSCFYLLVKYAEVTPKSFLCKGDSGVSEFKPANEGAGNMELIELWDFGAAPYEHCSYSYHLPFDKFALTTSSDPGMAVAADRNPFQASPSGVAKDFTLFNSQGDREQIKFGNAAQHQDEGQNVLFLDSHTSFEKVPMCGIGEDNIWTSWNGGRRQDGAPPVIGGAVETDPLRRVDSFLVTDGDGTGGDGGGDDPKTRACFLGQTVVWINGTQTKISNVTAGQSVASDKATAMSVSSAEVETVQEHTGTYDCYDVQFQSGNCITVADEHYFMLHSGRWRSVRKLTAGSELQSLDGTVTIKSISRRVQAFTGNVYNLKIKGSNQYAVGMDKLIVRDY